MTHTRTMNNYPFFTVLSLSLSCEMGDDALPLSEGSVTAVLGYTSTMCVESYCAEMN
jgi:hypothetical protein